MTPYCILYTYTRTHHLYSMACKDNNITVSFIHKKPAQPDVYSIIKHRYLALVQIETRLHEPGLYALARGNEQVDAKWRGYIADKLKEFASKALICDKARYAAKKYIDAYLVGTHDHVPFSDADAIVCAALRLGINAHPRSAPSPFKQYKRLSRACGNDEMTLNHYIVEMMMFLGSTYTEIVTAADYIHIFSTFTGRDIAKKALTYCDSTFKVQAMARYVPSVLALASTCIAITTSREYIQEKDERLCEMVKLLHQNMYVKGCIRSMSFHNWLARTNQT